jgi:hypothetical protein
VKKKKGRVKEERTTPASAYDGETDVVIPGRTEGANPESSPVGMHIWIPGSLAALAPRNDGCYPRISAVTWAATERDRPCKS